MWVLFICPRERALQVSQKVREDNKTQKERGKKLWQTKTQI